MDPMWLPRIMIHWKPEGRKQRGHPQRTWKDGIYTAMNEMWMGEWNNWRQWNMKVGRHVRHFKIAQYIYIYMIFLLHNTFLVWTELCIYLQHSTSIKKYYNFLLIDHADVWLLQTATANNFHDLLIFCSKWDMPHARRHTPCVQDISMPAVSFTYTSWYGVDTVVQEGLAIPHTQSH